MTGKEKKKSGITRLNVSRQREAGHPHPDREAAAGWQGRQSRATAEKWRKKDRNL